MLFDDLKFSISLSKGDWESFGLYSQLRTALIFNKKTKARNYTLETINKNIYIFGIAMNEEEKKEVINEANKIYDVEEVIPSIYLAAELSRTKI